ncbi:hypothetical protein GCM10008994_21410 [Halorubrum ejinorense]|uniref:Uncharacterized protein n=1 Tax=Halorubrum ejinorense TaxID=425309 RepID=A0AAV3SU39_9EURY
MSTRYVARIDQPERDYIWSNGRSSEERLANTIGNVDTCGTTYATGYVFSKSDLEADAFTGW